MIRAIVFDCFGVLASDGWLTFRRKHFLDKPNLSEQASALARQADAGRLSYGEFLREVARLAGVSEAAVQRELEGNAPDTELFRYMAVELKPHYRLGLLSNAAGNWLARIFLPEQLALFDAVALSYETGFVKPEPQSFAVIAQRLGANLSECVMVDDKPRFCEAAEAAGMRALTYMNAGQFARELPAVLKRG